ncbi:MAG: OsmC family protein [Sphingobacteriaceae bacterium]|nr:OsmC family protein [Sphingobacteriaceae bacterium]
MEINLSRKSGLFNFEATNESGFKVELDANPSIGGQGKGFRPMEMILVGLGGCSGIDMVNILSKQKEIITDLKIKINATRKTEEMTAVFDVVNIHFDLFGNLNTQKVERALALTFEKYCSVSAILSHTATINFSYKIH